VERVVANLVSNAIRHGGSHYLRVYLAQVRRKLEPDPAQPRYFLTEAGMGYRFLPGEPTGN